VASRICAQIQVECTFSVAVCQIAHGPEVLFKTCVALKFVDDDDDDDVVLVGHCVLKIKRDTFT